MPLSQGENPGWPHQMVGPPWVCCSVGGGFLDSAAEEISGDQGVVEVGAGD